jgi:multidrug efflux pump
MFRWLLKASPTIALLIAVVAFFGGVSYYMLPREASPDVKIPVVLVSTPYIGVSPQDIESLVSIPMENELAGLKGLKKMSSTSAEGVSIVSLEFEPEIVIEDALQRVRDRVNRAQSKLPEDAEDPMIQEISFSDMPIMIVNIAGNADQEQLKQLAEALEDEVKRIPGVLDTRISGGLEREIKVQLDPRRMASYGLSMNDVTGAIGNENVNIPGGDVASGDANFLLRVPGDFKLASDIEGVAIKRIGGRPVFIRDVGRVVDGYAPAASYARMNRAPSVSLAITKRAGASIIDISDEVKVVAAAHQAKWPKGVEHRVLADQSKMIRNMVADLENNIITSLILVIGVVIIFMGLRSSLFVGFAIPMSMLLTFITLDLLGITLNMIVLFSLILALGMLVDNAIVIVENIYRHVEEGKSVIQGTIDGTAEVAMPVISSTATTVAAFFPLVFWTGIMGQFMGFLPKTVIIVLTASLLVALLMLPVLVAAMLRKKADGKLLDAESDVPQNKVMALYKRTVEFSIDHRYLSAAGGVATLFGTFIIYGAFNHGTEFFPNTEPDRAIIGVRAPDGTDLETTDRIVRRIEEVLATTPNVDVFVAETGVAAAGGGGLGGSQSQENAATITIDFLPHKNEPKPDGSYRVESTHLTVAHLRETFKAIPGAEIEVNPEGMGPPVGAPIAVEVSGDDFYKVGEYAQKVRRELALIPGTTELADDFKVGRPEMRLRVDRGAAKRVGASTVEIANTVRTAVAGATASTLRDGKDEYDIKVELDPRYKDSLQDVLSLRVPGRIDTSPSTFHVPLSTVASYELAGGSGAIRHIDQRLVVSISGDVAEGYNENDVRNAVIAKLDELKQAGDVPTGMVLRLGGANDEQQEASIFLGRAFLLAIALVGVVLVAQFNNFRLPAIILFTVVLSLVGVLWGLLLTGTSFGVIMTGLGVISLAGVVVNNAIVLLDYIEQLKGMGVPVRTALVRAGMTRFRPVMLTAGTTVLGLVPMALAVSIDFAWLPWEWKIMVGGSNAEFWGPMAIAVIFGLGFATILTLVMVPTFYSILNDYDEWRAKRAAARATAPEGGSAGLSPAKLLPLVVGLPLLTSPSAEAAEVTLDQAWASAEQSNVDLQLAREQTTQLRTLSGQAWALVSPKATLGATYTINQYEIGFDPGDSFGFLNDAFSDIYTRFGWAYQDMLAMGAGGSEAVTPGSALNWTGGALGAYRSNLDARLASGELSQEEYDATIAALEGRAGDTSGDSSDSGGGDGKVVIQQKAAFGWNANLIQPLFNGRSLPVLKGAYAMIRAAEQDEARVRQQVRAGVARSYYGLYAARRAKDLSEQSLATALHHQELTRRQIAAGTLAERARYQADLAVAQAKRDLARANEQVDVAELTFHQTTGLPQDSTVSLPPTAAVAANVDEALRLAMDARPDLKAASERIYVQERYQVAKRGEWLPTVDARFTYNWSQNLGFQPEKGMWMLVFSANWTLWDGGLRIAQGKEEASKLAQARLVRARQEQSAEQEVRTAWVRMERTAEALRSTEQELVLARENLRLAEAALSAGSATWLEVEDARLGLLGAELSGLQERMNHDLALIDVQLATGQL